MERNGGAFRVGEEVVLVGPEFEDDDGKRLCCTRTSPASIYGNIGKITGNTWNPTIGVNMDLGYYTAVLPEKTHGMCLYLYLRISRNQNTYGCLPIICL